MATVSLHPSSTVESSGWTISSGDAHDVVSDTSDTSHLRCGSQNRYAIFMLDNFGEDFSSIDSIRWYVRATMYLTRSSAQNTAIQVRLGNSIHTSSSTSTSYYDENVTVEFQAGYVQNDYFGTARTTSNGSDSWTGALLNGLRLDVNTSPAEPPGLSKIQVAKCNLEVTYKPATTAENAIFFGANF